MQNSIRDERVQKEIMTTAESRAVISGNRVTMPSHDHSLLTFGNNTPSMKTIGVKNDQRASRTLNWDRFWPLFGQIPDGYVFHVHPFAQVAAANLSPSFM